MVIVAVGFDVSIPSKLTVPVGSNCKLSWLGALIFTVTFITVTGFVALGPPRLAMLQITRLVLINPGTGALHVTGLLPVLGEVLTPVIVSKLSMFSASNRLLACTPVVFWTVQVKVPGCPGLRLVGTPLPEIGTEIWAEPDGGGVPGGEVVRCSSLKVVDVPARSLAVTRDVSVICAKCIWTATSMTTTCPGDILPSEQATLVTPVPPAVQVPCGGSATMTNAPSVVLRTLFTITFVTGKSEVLVTVTS